MNLEMLENDLNEIIADLPINVTYKGTIYIGTMSNNKVSRNEQMAGYYINYDAMVYFNINTFDTIPAIGETLHIKNEKYRIDSIDKGQDELGIIFNLIKVT